MQNETEKEEIGMSDLLDCPFCGNKPDRAADGCVACFTPNCVIHCVIIERDMWNTRSGPTSEETLFDKGWRLAKEGHGLSNLWGNCADDSEMDEVYRGMKAYWNSVK